MRSLSSIIKNHRTLQGNVITIGKEQPYFQTEKNSSSTGIATEATIEEIDFTFLEEEAKKEAMRIVQEAELKAQAILDQTQEQVYLMKQSFEEEMATYRNQVEEEVQAKQTQARQEVESIINAAYLEKESILKQAEPEIVELIVTLLHKIIDVKLISGIEWLTLFVKQVVEKEQFKESLQVIVAPQVLETHEEILKEAFKDLPVEVELLSDGRMKHTACRVETRTGGIMYDIEEGLQKILDELQLLCMEG